jgi:two-component system, OmpR family, response regulator
MMVSGPSRAPVIAEMGARVQRLRVLVVEDDVRLAAVIGEQLHEEDFDVRLARSIAEAERLLPDLRPHCVLLDVGLPDGSGFDLCRRLRRAGGSWDPSLAIIMLTARVEEADVLRGFERGADDYVRKPFSIPELVSRVRVALVRRRPAGGGDLSVERLMVDLGSRTATYADQVLELAGKEFALLVELASDPGVLCTKQDLLERVWDYRSRGRTRTVDSHASRLRRKLQAAGAPGDPIANVWGAGYRLELPHA